MFRPDRKMLADPKDGMTDADLPLCFDVARESPLDQVPGGNAEVERMRIHRIRAYPCRVDLQLGKKVVSRAKCEYALH